MNILLTNDDGIFSSGIYALYLKLKKLGKVTVVAPDSERSSVGHGITLSHPIWYRKTNRKDKFFGYAVKGTPADCVKFAIAVLLKKKPDIVVSGINLGPNDGCSVHYSGTVAGAREAALMGIPAVASSLDTFTNPDFSYAAEATSKVIKNMKKYPIPKKSFLNVNVPNVSKARIKGFVATKQCMVPIHGTFKRRVDPNLKDYYWMSGKLPTKRRSTTIDTYALKSNYVTITPIQCDSTNYDLLDEMKGWELTHDKR